MRSNEWMLFGFDLTKVVGLMRLGFKQILHDHSSWLARKFQPPLWVKVGDQWQGWTDCGPLDAASQAVDSVEAEGDRFVGLLLHNDSVLFKRMSFPESQELYLEDAVSLEIATSSPFPPDKQISGWKIIRRGADVVDILIAISTRDAAESVLSESKRDREHAGTARAVAVCVLSEDGSLIEFDAYVSPAREMVYLRRLREVAAGLGVAMICVCLLLALPVMSSAYRATRLTQQYESIQQSAAAVDQSIERLHAQRSQLGFILEDYQARPDIVAWLEGVASVTPDGTFLESMKVEGSRVEVTGYSDNAAAYLRLLTEQDGYTNVNARSAFVREQRSGLERFTIDWSFVSEET